MENHGCLGLMDSCWASYINLKYRTRIPISEMLGILFLTYHCHFTEVENNKYSQMLEFNTNYEFRCIILYFFLTKELGPVNPKIWDKGSVVVVVENYYTYSCNFALLCPSFLKTDGFT